MPTREPRIEDYALVGDRQTAALIGRNGSVDWLCLPAFDAPACFASLLGGPGAGHWRIAPAAGDDGSDVASVSTTRSYRGDTLVLETVWRTADAEVVVIDFMPPRGEHPDLVRIVEGRRGRLRMRCDLRVRFDYGHVVPWVERRDGRWSAVAGPDSLWLDTPVRLTGQDRHTSVVFDVAAGDRVPFVLTWAPSFGPPPPPVDPDQALQDTLAFWNGWIDRCRYTGDHADAVHRSLLTLEALTYAPTGGIVAAVTTSLPEQLGGPRNWDYRYCWLRDASFTLQALAGAGYTDEARAWRDWLLRAVGGDPAELRIMYSLTGNRRLPEQELPWLDGFGGSRPVRIGNAASDQFQLDVYGEVLDSLDSARTAGLSPDEHAWSLQCVLTEYLESVWSHPDSSLWEMRGPRRHFVHSKVMAWVGFDRMIRTARRAGLDAPVERWTAARRAIREEVLARGYDADRRTFTQFYGSRGLDAALLLLPRLGFLPADDPRIRGTIEAVERELLHDGMVLRYRPDADPSGDHGTVDGLPGAEGAFLACTFWLADALGLSGRREEARALFERLLGMTNDVGLLSEEWDPVARRQLGNLPQAFSHVALVNSALVLG